MAYEPDFENPTTETIHWIEENLSYYEKHNDKKAISVFRSLLQETKEKMGIITRSNEQTESTQRPSGISYMVQCALGGSSKPNSEQPQEEQARSGFSEMLSASCKGKKPDVVERQNQPFPAIQRQVDFEMHLPEICNETCPIKRHCSSYPAQIGNLCVKVSEQYKNKERIKK